jgi:dynein heavy chain
MYWEADLPNDPKDGAYIFGFQVEGARWDWNVNTLEESFPKVNFAIVPVILARAVSSEGMKIDKNVYQCPVYKTENRMTTYVFHAQMKSTKYNPAKWILAGVALILDVEGVSDQFAPSKEIPLS